MTFSLRVVWRALALLACVITAGTLPAPVVAQGSSPFTTVILVRHAEKGPEARDPSLSPEGRERASTLAHVLGEVDVAAIYSTQFTRTLQTAEPAARRLGMAVTIVSAGATYVQEMVRIIRADHVGQVVVVVSHSNTVPAIIGELGAGPAPTIRDDEYDDLYIVTLTADGDANLLALRYGRESP